MTISIVIANWNTKELIEDCINSIFNSTPLNEMDYEVIIIDNASADGSRKYLRSIKNKITLIENDTNVGYAKACNQGMKIAKGRYVLLLGSDTIMKPGTLRTCSEFLDTTPGAGAVSCKLLNPDGSTQNSLKKFPKLKNAFYTYLSFDKLNREYDMSGFEYNTTCTAQQAAATFLMIRRDLLEKISYFDESYRILYNDVDLCSRIWKAGYKIYFLHTASIIHYGSHSTKNADFALRKIMYSDIYRYYSKHFGFKAKFLYPILAFRLIVVSTIKA
ncbi:MAG TPA: glycosyltransferase family 2 protein [Ignavibacteria bacterium]|nr:glycosyltransferase family 2 protein [Ignavibacteria bacterium]HMQ97684.1 glycosyltransferase family 2 protein [Ignavibacteria bacterium]